MIKKYLEIAVVAVVAVAVVRFAAKKVAPTQTWL